MAARTMLMNGLEEVIRVHHGRVEEADRLLGRGTLDAVVCNPPYAPPGTSLHNPSEALSAARHQPEEGIEPWFRMAHRVLKGKGRIFVIYPAPHLLSLMKQL